MKVDQTRFRDAEFTDETIHMFKEKIVEFLYVDDGQRCREDDLTYPYKRGRDGRVEFLPGYRFTACSTYNTAAAQVEGIDPEAVYWVRERLLRKGRTIEEVPPLPELDWYEYSFKPWKRSEQLHMHAEHGVLEKDDRTMRREKREEKRQEQWLEKLGQALGFSTEDPSVKLSGSTTISMDTTIDTEDETESPEMSE